MLSNAMRLTVSFSAVRTLCHKNMTVSLTLSRTGIHLQ